MHQNRISEFDMDPGDERVDNRGRRPPAVTVRGIRLVPSVLAVASTADIFQAAVKKAVEDYELNRLFNPDYYDYQI